MTIRADVPVSTDVTFLTLFIFPNADVAKSAEAVWTDEKR
jgi:hypothetical protein